MSKIEKLSLKELQDLESYFPILADFPSRVLANTYIDFVDILYKDITTIVNDFQSNPQYYQDDSEDKLTYNFCTQLKRLGYDSSHGSTIGGETDLLVKSYTSKEYMWIGEAKIHGSYDYLYEGFLQLNTRYSTGAYNQSDGGLLIYIRQKNSKLVIDKWKEHLSEKQLPSFDTKPCPNNLDFFSVHEHETSGLPFRIKHIPIMLYFNPQDKSARQRKSNK